MSLFTIFLPLIAQVGPNPAAVPQTVPPELRDRPARSAPKAPPPVITRPTGDAESPRLARCLADAQADSEVALTEAETWGRSGDAASLPDAKFCAGMAHYAAGDLAEASTEFLAALAITPEASPARRARLGALAGHVAIARNDADAAVRLFETAAADARSGGDPKFAGEIEIDRARALVPLGRNGEAAMALAAAAAVMPDNAQVWLLSATLARRVDQIDRAQTFIQQAGELNPTDPQIGLEAGVIAMLGGREDAARRSWQSVIAAAPGSNEAQTARGYLAQLPKGTDIIGR